MAIPNRPVVDTEKSVQNIFNNTYDKDFDVVAFELLGYDSSSSTLKRVGVDGSGNFQVQLATIATNHLDDYTTTNVTYVGQEDNTGVWKIIKIDETGNFPVYTYASISNNPTQTTYTLGWNNRVTLTYNLYSVAF